MESPLNTNGGARWTGLGYKRNQATRKPESRGAAGLDGSRGATKQKGQWSDLNHCPSVAKRSAV